MGGRRFPHRVDNVARFSLLPRAVSWGGWAERGTRRVGRGEEHRRKGGVGDGELCEPEG